MKEELVSIITPSYNTGNHIVKTIDSVLTQTYKNWEMIIVDDCSTDNTIDIINNYKYDKRIKVVVNEKNSGAAISRNKGLRLAKGKWIAFLDSDDLWEPRKLELQIQYMKENDYKFSYTDYQIIQPNGEKLPYVCTAPNKITKLKLYQYCYFSTITVIYDSEAVGLIQIADLKKNNDYAMWFQAVEKVDLYRYPVCLSYYCKRENSISSGSKIKLIKHHYILFHEGLKKRKVISIMLTINNLLFGVIKKIKFRKYI